MAERPITPGRGPYLQLACFCEKVITDTTGALSLIRIVDRFTQAIADIDPPEQMPPFVLSNLSLVLAIKAGEARGRYALKVRPEDPSGVQLPAFEIPVQLSPGNAGINYITDFQLAVQHEGVYWFDVLFAPGGGAEDWLLTRMPLEVLYQPQRLAPAAP